MVQYKTTSLFKDRSIDPLFPSLVFKSQLADISICDSLEKTVMKMWKKKEGPLVEKDMFVTNDNLNELPDFKELSDIILEESRDVLDTFRVVRTSHYISSMWASVSTGNNMHHKHVHPNNFLSGVFYVKIPDKCGPIVFSDPRPGAEMIQPDYADRSIYNAGKVTMHPKAGQLMFWQSFLPHSVERAESRDKNLRIAIPFNVMIKGPVTSYTLKHEF
jgi:uncharacterized protein (TIGR02466 family)